MNVAKVQHDAKNQGACVRCLHNGTGFPVVMQPVRPVHKIYPAKCTACDAATDRVMSR